ncbi:MAG: TMEM175 family protein [Chloroflexi bacterium]|nr:TMEM175 family protein [Chloroflexota bacterium]
MHKGRMEAFSDGVIAIIITIMILELKIPEEGELAALIPLIPKFLSYIFSFVFIGIYWNNHHHLLQAAKQVNGAVLWANLNFLFWLSMVPFVTGWMGENNFSTIPVAAYGVVLLLSGLAFYILVRTLVTTHGADSVLADVLGKDKKGMYALLIYIVAIPLSFVSAWVAVALYVAVSIMYLVPEKRIENKLAE